ncbi:hypothetical protein [Pseudomonas sp.]|uniref:hypothetical protein n=1 Tax=Pseudomonas sp. TaxID=306 RepID=UPI003FD76824
MKLLTNASLLAAFALISACGRSETSPIEVSLGQSMGLPDVYLQAITDKVTIKGLKINRGSCMGMGPSLPADLVFGERRTISVYGCTVKEVSVETDHGNFTYSF